MSEQDIIKLIIRKQKIEEYISNLTDSLKQIERAMNHFDLEYWWKPFDMCCNHEECGDDCFNGCDMPKEMWEDKKRELIKEWG